MKNNQLLRSGETIIRVLDIKGGKAFIIDCKRQTVPKWVDIYTLADYETCPDDVLDPLPNINDLDMQSRKFAYEHFTYIAGVLPFVTDKKRRCEAITQITEERRISKQTVCNYLWLYLVNQNIAALSPKNATMEKSLTEDEKNIRWALNKFFYTQNKNSLNTAYTLMLKEKYCNAEGVLLPQYPSFYQFRYYYRQHKKMQNYYISRNGIKNYQRNNRPLLGDGIQEFAPAVGVGMLDATICDIYLVNEAGGIVGRPILTACVDAYSGLCCGYSLSWEGGVYSLRNLMTNVISDKTELCRKHGISINPLKWNCDMLPATLVTDMGKEYVSNTFEQIADLGITIVNLQPYRPELKGAVEKFFDVVQGLYKPHLKGKGVIEPNYQERGAHDYRKDARLTMADFEKIILRCIVYYNSQRIVENFPYTENMLADGVKPYASEIWNYGLNQAGANLIPADYNTLVLTLLPRTTGKFSRKGLIVNKLRYKHDGFTERYLNGGTVTVAYNPEDVAEVWLFEKGVYMTDRPAIDWAVYDAETAPILERVARSIYDGTASETGRPERVSEKVIYREMNLPAHRLENLPLCKAVFDRYSESYEENWARRIVWGYNKLKANNAPFYWSDIRRITGVKKKNIEKVIPHIRKFTDKKTTEAIIKLVGGI